jgi:long-chain fatty acid transport protein
MSMTRPVVKALLISTICAGVFVIGTSGAQAGAFYLQEQSTTAMGSEFAGAGADVRDASIMYYNPAGMTQLGRAQINGNVSVLKTWEKNQNEGSSVTSLLTGPGSTGNDRSDDAIPTTALPALYAAAPIPYLDDKLWVGFGLSVPFGLSTKYNDDWFGRYDSIKSELSVIDFEPTVAYKATDWLSIGGGVDVERAVARLTNEVTNGITSGQAVLRGSDWDTGFNLGVLLTPVQGTNIGLDYRSRVDHNIKGSINVAGVPAFGPVPGLNESTSATAALNLPDVYGISLSQQIAPQWKGLAQVNYFHWGVFNEIDAIPANGTPSSITPEDYNDSFSFAVGGEYAWRPDVTFRAGYEFDETPTHSPDRDTRVPDGNRNNFGTGVSWDITKDIELSGAVSYSLMGNSSADVTRNAGLATVDDERTSTSYLFGSVGATYKF